MSLLILLAGSSDASTPTAKIVYAAGDALTAFSVARTTPDGVYLPTQTGSGGNTLSTVADDVIRDAHYIGANRTLVVEPQRTEWLVHTDQPTSVQWSNVGTITTGITDPKGTTQAIRLVMPSGSQAFHRQPQIAAQVDPLLRYQSGIWARAASSGGAAFFRITSNDTVAWDTGKSTKFPLTSSWQFFEADISLVPGSADSMYWMVGNTDVSGNPDATCAGDVEFAFGSQRQGKWIGTTIVNSEAFEVIVTADVLTMAIPVAGQGIAGTVYGRFEDLSTGATVEETFHFTAGTTVVIPVGDGRGYRDIKYANGERSLAFMQALVDAAVVTPSPAVSTWVAVNPAVTLGGVTASPAPAIVTWVSAAPTTPLGNVTPATTVAVRTWVSTNPSTAQGSVSALPPPAIRTWVVPTAVVTLGGVTASPAPAISTWVSVNPAVTVGGITASPAPAIRTWVNVNPAVALGGVTASPAPAISTWVVPSAVFGVLATPLPAISTWVIPTPVVTGALSVSPLPATRTWANVNPGVTLGGVTASPLPSIRTWVSVNPSITLGGVTASPAPAISTWVVPAVGVALGGVTASPTPAVRTWVSTNPATAVGGVTASPAPAVSTWVIPNALGLLGGSVQPSPAVSTWVAVSPAVTLGNVSAQPSPAVQSWTTISPSVALAVTVTPVPAVQQWTSQAPATSGGLAVPTTPSIRSWTALSPTVTLGDATTQPSPSVQPWVAVSPSVTMGDVVAEPAPAVRLWVALPGVLTDSSTPATAIPAAGKRTWRNPAAMFRAPLTFTSQDIMQQVAEALVGILDTDQDVVAITGRASINCVPFEDTTFNLLPIFDYFILDGTQVGGVGDTREVTVDIRATAELGSTCNEMLRLAEEKLIAPRFAAIGLDACALRAKRRDVDVDPDAEQDVKTKLLELTLLVTI